MTSIDNEVLIFGYLLLFSYSYIFCRLIDAIEVVLNDIELFNSESNCV